jgi:molecular chaperone HtpG
VTELKTNAEKRALEASELKQFHQIALRGIKEQVAEMLGMIGRVAEIFATYTRHDISHVNAMLGYLDWLIPPKTQETMTPVDWLLITMAIFLHDLGMIVTRDEFDKRSENEAFNSFMHRLATDPEAKDYLNRAKKMNEEERQKFFFQEFIRENHPLRIKEWVTGQYSRHWGDTARPVTEAISKLMEPFPSRFRRDLGSVCESHHRNDLNKFDLYPLCQAYGSEKAEIANVQYAALILRTVDLIHITKDRTPSVMYGIIKFTDPKGVDEWDKQRSTFAVRHAGREFDPNDATTHDIVISADFTEEKPFFALTEYLAWADNEIKQTKRWGDLAAAEKFTTDFIFPWRSVRGDLRVEGNEPKRMRFEFDRGRLLDLLVGHAIYNDATVAVRELLQNGIDAVRFQHHLENKEAEAAGCGVPDMGEVHVMWDAKTRKLIVEDNGIGMNLDVIEHHLMRVGASFYDTPQFASEYKAFTPISRFGIGILTCFMISDDIEIVTFKSACGYRIRMSSVHADYLLRELPPGSPELAGIEPHGTRVTLIIREGVDLAERSIGDILRYWIILPECRVEFTEAQSPTMRIGFDSPAAALTSYYDREGEEYTPASWGLELISKQHSKDGGRYDLAVAVQSKWSVEKMFARPPRGSPPAVCIEGIRVADHLPGFNFSDRYSAEVEICALVSVRGVRGLRTTVSRSRLEEDQAYLNLGAICAELLIRHIEDEVHRISSSKWKPYSRASTAGHWLFTDLKSAAGFGYIATRLDSLRKKLPLIVMEAIKKDNGSPAVERTLITPGVLQTQGHFWTIESRLIESLGNLTRSWSRIKFERILESVCARPNAA